MPDRLGVDSVSLGISATIGCLLEVKELAFTGDTVSLVLAFSWKRPTELSNQLFIGSQIEEFNNLLLTGLGICRYTIGIDDSSNPIFSVSSSISTHGSP